MDTTNQPNGPEQPRIQHNNPGFGSQPAAPASPDPSGEAPLPIEESSIAISKKITAFGKERRHEDEWTRTPNTTGAGAIHVKTFHSKLTDDALNYMDRCINEWLDAHPQYEVKFVNSTIGTLTGKLKEPHIICQIWV